MLAILLTDSSAGISFTASLLRTASRNMTVCDVNKAERNNSPEANGKRLSIEMRFIYTSRWKYFEIINSIWISISSVLPRSRPLAINVARDDGNPWFVNVSGRLFIRVAAETRAFLPQHIAPSD